VPRHAPVHIIGNELLAGGDPQPAQFERLPRMQPAGEKAHERPELAGARLRRILQHHHVLGRQRRLPRHS